GALDIRTRSANVVDRKTNTTGALRDQRALLQGIVNTFDGIVLHGKQEAGRHLWFGRTSIEESRRSMRKPLFAQQVVGFYHRRNIVHVDTYGYAHQHMLRTLHDLAVALHQVRALQRFKAKVVVSKVTAVIDGVVQRFG